MEIDYEPGSDPVIDDYLANLELLAGIITGDQLDAKVFPPLRWAVPGLIPEGFGLFTGPPKIGKSWCVLGIALAIAAGGRALGKVPAGEPRPVLYLALEDGERRLQDRCRHLLIGEAIPANLHLMTKAPDAGVLPVIAAWLDQHAPMNPLIVLDTLGRVMPSAKPGESAYERDYRIGARLKALVDDHPGSTLLVVHHVRKAVSADWMDSTSGTNGLNGAADFTVNLSRERSEEDALLRVTGRDVAEAEYAITGADGSWFLDGEDLTEAAQKVTEDRAAAGLGDRSAEILRWVGSHPGGVSAKDVAAALGLKDNAARSYLSRLADAGRITKPSRGLYAPVATVASVAFEGDNATVATVATPLLADATDPSCTVCGFPIHPLHTAAGHTTHPTCEEAS